jgi:tRNA pseudouridine55 synthase
MNPDSGILLVDKPAGVTSFGVVNRVRQRLVSAFPALSPKRTGRGGPRPPRFKCGHAGTLDPLATGLLVVLIGKGSRLSPFLMGLDKSYLATVRFGALTDTLDSEGEITATGPPPPDAAAVEACLEGFRGEIMQVPPVFSALKQGGQSLHRKVRSGQDYTEPEARPVTIGRLELLDSRWGVPEDDPRWEADLLVGCSSGTYIRSLARDIAVAAGSLGHITALRRLEVGPFNVADAVAGVMEMSGEELAARVRPLTEALPQAPRLELDAREAALVRQGGQPQRDWTTRLDGAPVSCGKGGRIFRMIDGGGVLVAIGRLDETTGEPRIAAVISNGG